MAAWEQGEHDDQDKRGMCKPHQRAEPPGGKTECVKESGIQECHPPSVEEVDHKADHLRAIAIRRDHRAEEKGHIHPGQMQRLAGPEKSRQQACG